MTKRVQGLEYPPSICLSSNFDRYNAGQPSTLSWQVSNADTVTISTLGTVALSGSQALTPATTTTYTLTATHGTQTATANATVTVNSGTTGGLPVIVSFAPNPATIDFGQSSVLSGAVSVNVNGVVFTTPTAVESVHVITTTTYNCTATAADGQTASAQTTVTVAGPIDPSLPKK